MATTYTLIASSTVGAGGAASIDFSSIPSTYTDLLVKISARGTTSALQFSVNIKLNNTSETTNWTTRFIEGDGATATSSNGAYSKASYAPAATATANTFGNVDIYIPNYAGSTNKSLSVDSVHENNATTAYADLFAELWSNTSAINQITLVAGTGNFAQYSTAYLYGITKA